MRCKPYPPMPVYINSYTAVIVFQFDQFVQCTNRAKLFIIQRKFKETITAVDPDSISYGVIYHVFSIMPGVICIFPVAGPRIILYFSIRKDLLQATPLQFIMLQHPNTVRPRIKKRVVCIPGNSRVILLRKLYQFSPGKSMYVKCCYQALRLHAKDFILCGPKRNNGLTSIYNHL